MERKSRRCANLRERNSKSMRSSYHPHITEFHCTDENNEIYVKDTNDNGCIRENLQNNNKRISIDTLNDDCLRYIFKFLPITDKIRAERVCKRWRAVSRDSWHTMKVLDFFSSTWGSLNRKRLLVPMLRKVFLRCGRFLRELHLINRDYYLVKGTFSSVAYLCPNITNVYITEETSTNNILALGKNCKNITRLTIRGYSSYYFFHDEDHFLNIFKNLEYLKIVDLNHWLLQSCLPLVPAEKLHTLILSYDYIINDRICDQYLFETLERLKNLEMLEIRGHFDLGICILDKINKFCINLKTLHYDCTLNLRKFRMDCTSLHFTNLVKLEKISFMANNRWIEDDGIRDMVLNCQKLIDVDISACNLVTNTGLAAIATLPKLEKLNIGVTKQFTHQGLSNIRNLKVFKCYECDNITKEDLLIIITSSPQLELVDITGCDNINKHFFEVVEVITEIYNRRANNILKMIIGIRKPFDDLLTMDDSCLHLAESPCKFLQIVINRIYLTPRLVSTIFGPCHRCRPDKVDSPRVETS